MDDITGTWDVSLATPIGRQEIVVRLLEQGAPSELTGNAASARETVELQNLRRDGETLRWEQSVRHPIRLNLAFAVRIEGDRMVGEAKAGPLPSTSVSGSRRVLEA
ncbi:hypothetical protein [Herbiconiux sp. UC225_62]|uniref:hypothetical protein n=1 Tax=Herbiconiux sp. UC225_62 TaxID=3350168 RepID=UPI0036D41F29